MTCRPPWLAGSCAPQPHRPRPCPSLPSTQGLSAVNCARQVPVKQLQHANACTPAAACAQNLALPAPAQPRGCAPAGRCSGRARRPPSARTAAASPSTARGPSGGARPVSGNPQRTSGACPAGERPGAGPAAEGHAGRPQRWRYDTLNELHLRALRRHAPDAPPVQDSGLVWGWPGQEAAWQVKPAARVAANLTSQACLRSQHADTLAAAHPTHHPRRPGTGSAGGPRRLRCACRASKRSLDDEPLESPFLNMHHSNLSCAPSGLRRAGCRDVQPLCAAVMAAGRAGQAWATHVARHASSP